MSASTKVETGSDVERDLANDKRHYVCGRCRAVPLPPGEIVTAICGALFRADGGLIEAHDKRGRCPDCIAEQISHGHLQVVS